MNIENNNYKNNLELFGVLSRFNSKREIIRVFFNAYCENKDLALANLLYFLDIREGKGERKIFKTIFKYLGNNYPNSALVILPFIGKLGRYDCILEGLNTKIENAVLLLINEQLKKDLASPEPSLLAKWLPSIRCHNKTNIEVKELVKKLGMSEKKYRKTLSKLRSKLNIIEKCITNMEYDKIDFNKTPTKAMIKYRHLFETKITDKYNDFLLNVSKGNYDKINTNGRNFYDIIRTIKGDNIYNLNSSVFDLMWKHKKDVLKEFSSNILVVPEISYKSYEYKKIPYSLGVGLAIYTGERNNGYFKDKYMTFSEVPNMHTIRGDNLITKVDNFDMIGKTTNIDQILNLLLNLSLENNINKEEMPKYIFIISTLGFGDIIKRSNDTNLDIWKEKYKENSFNFPKVIFWNVLDNQNNLPDVYLNNDVWMINGFSEYLVDNLFKLESYTKENLMLDKLNKYIEMLKTS